MGKICSVCGKPAYAYYGMCKECMDLKKDGKIIECTNCGAWRKIDEMCKKCGGGLLIQNNKKVTECDLNQKIQSQLKCIICGEDSNGLHFCKSCYAKYKDRAVDIRVTHCCETEILDDYGNKKLTCEDGRKVRSKSELIISNFLFYNKIRAVYEREIFYNENGVDKTLHPDFYLPDYDIFIEHNGYKGVDYERTKTYSQKIYSQLGFKVIITSEDDLENINKCLKPQLGLH